MTMFAGLYTQKQVLHKHPVTLEIRTLTLLL